MRKLGLICLLAAASAIVFWAFTNQGHAETQADDDICAPPNIATDIRPDADGPATEVLIGVRMVDLTEINDVAQTLTGDFAVVLSWTDPRLSHLQGCEISLDDVWSPGIVFGNSGRLFTSRPREVAVGPDGRVSYIQRYYGTLASYHSLQEFPFDKQEIAVSLLPLELSEEEVMLIADERVTGHSDRLNISDWTIEGTSGSVHSQFLDAFQRMHSRFDLQINANRLSDFYVWKILLPLTLIVAMSWSVFWINPAQFGTQIGLSATAMLTLIAFIFATSNIVPKLGYFTVLDRFINAAMIAVFLALIQSLMTTYLVANERAELAMRIDRICRVAFPLGFALLVYVVLSF